MTMLNGQLSLHGVDVERLARSVLDDALRTRNIALDEHRRADLLADLIASAWELSLRYDVDRDYALERGRKPGFDGWATYWLRKRVVDWFRRTEGRTKWQFSTHTYERAKPVLISLDDSDEPLGSRSVDLETDSEADLGGLLERGDSAEAWAATQDDYANARRPSSRAA